MALRGEKLAASPMSSIGMITSIWIMLGMRLSSGLEHHGIHRAKARW